jgi:hypothetical protein
MHHGPCNHSFHHGLQSLGLRHRTPGSLELGLAGSVAHWSLPQWAEEREDGEAVLVLLLVEMGGRGGGMDLAANDVEDQRRTDFGIPALWGTVCCFDGLRTKRRPWGLSPMVKGGGRGAQMARHHGAVPGGDGSSIKRGGGALVAQMDAA